MNQITSSISTNTSSFAIQEAQSGSQPQGLSTPPSDMPPDAPDTQQIPPSSLSTNTVEVILHLLPEDGHPQGRRVRYALAIGGKTVVIGGKRLSMFVEQLATCSQEQVEQLLEQVERYVTTRQQQIQQTQPGLSSRVPSRAAAVSRPQQSVSDQTQEQPQQLSLF